jgi:hypothetical protein
LLCYLLGRPFEDFLNDGIHRVGVGQESTPVNDKRSARDEFPSVLPEKPAQGNLAAKDVCAPFSPPSRAEQRLQFIDAHWCYLPSKSPTARPRTSMDKEACVVLSVVAGLRNFVNLPNG